MGVGWCTWLVVMFVWLGLVYEVGFVRHFVQVRPVGARWGWGGVGVY